MRAICQVCKDKDKCSYLANNRTRDCIDIQTSDYGYDEAVDKACEVYCSMQCNYDTRQMCLLNKHLRCLSYETFKKVMEK